MNTTTGPPGRNMGLGTKTPLKGTWDHAARQEVSSYRNPCEQTHTCENIIVPQTSFAGGNKSNQM